MRAYPGRREKVRHYIRERMNSFPARIYLYIVGPLIGFGVVLTAVFVHTQSQTLERHLRTEGETLASVLAQDVRVGVFSENQPLIADVTEGIASRPGVLAVSVFNERLKLLQRRWGSRTSPSESGWRIDERVAGDALKIAPRPLVVDAPKHVTFWAAVYTRGTYSTDESLYFADTPPDRERLSGLVAVMLSKRPLSEGRRALIARALLILAVVSVFAALVTLFAVREASRPLAQLLERVKRVEVPHPTFTDDVGVLSDTFSHLVASLQEAFARISDLNETLEQKVSERTAALAAANEELTLAREHLEDRVRERTVELEKTHRQLLHAEKMSAMGRMSASLAHEINNPVFAIRNVLEGLKAVPALGERERELLAAASEECSRVARLIRDLQSFNRPSTGARGLVQIEALLDAVLLLCRKELSSLKIALETSYGGNLPTIWAAADQIKQVFLNLFTNAMDAMAAGGGTLRVSAYAEGGEIVVQIQDTGPGISGDDLPRIFEPFFTTKPEVKGTGLGLSISAEIVRNHGGSLSVQSDPGQGATFLVRLPVPTGDIS